VTGGAAERYTIDMTHEVRQRLKALARRAIVRGQADSFVAALKFIHNQLESSPLAWGEPKFTYRHMHLTMCYGLYRSFGVSYAVDPERRIVYIRAFEALPQSGLEDESQGDDPG
jgi:hypothetical protein